MAKAKLGDTIKAHYVGTLNDGTIFDSSEGRPPTQFKIGAGRLLAPFERAFIGKGPGETIEVRIPAKQAFGEFRDDLVYDINRSDIPVQFEIRPGQQFQIRQKEGGSRVFTIAAVNGDRVTLDGNHPLAGEDLRFRATLVEIVS